MKLSGRALDDFEAACLDGRRVAWFGSYAIGDGEVVACESSRWISGELHAEVRPTMSSREHTDPAGTWYDGLTAEEYEALQRDPR